MEQFWWLKKLPVSLQSQKISILQVLRDTASPFYYFDSRVFTGKDFSVARICLLFPGNSELYLFHFIFTEIPMSSFSSGRKREGREYRTFWDTAVAMGLYKDGLEFENFFDDLFGIRTTPSTARWMLLGLYQFGVDMKAMSEIYQCNRYSDFNERGSRKKKEYLMRWLVEISDVHGGPLLLDHPLYPSRARISTTGLEQSWISSHLQQMNTTERQSQLHQRLEQLNTDQRLLFDKIMKSLERKQAEETTASNGKLFSFKEALVLAKRILWIFCKNMQSKGHIVLIASTTGAALSIHANGQTIHILFSLGMNDKACSDPSASIFSKYGPHFNQAELLRNSALLVVDEASMTERRLLEMADVVLKDLLCYLRSISGQRLAGICMVFSEDYLQLLSVALSCKYI